MKDSRTEMMQAIREAAAPDAIFTGSSLPNGLRAIKTFERVNGVAFDPSDAYHRDIVRGKGVHEQLFRRVAALRGGKGRL